MRKTGFPKSIDVKRGVSYRIEFVDAFDDPEQVGVCMFRDKLILIKAGMSRKSKLETLIHEVIHAIIWENGIRLGEKLEESVITMMERPIYKFLKVNGWV